MRDLEAHSVTSLAHRLRLLVSRGTLREWIKTGKLVPASVQAKSSRYLIFPTLKLNQLLALLEKGYEERVGRLAESDAEALAFRAHADALAVSRIKNNASRAKLGKKALRESSPSMNDDDAVGRQNLTDTEPKTKLFTGYNIHR